MASGTKLVNGIIKIFNLESLHFNMPFLLCVILRLKPEI